MQCKYAFYLDVFALHQIFKKILTYLRAVQRKKSQRLHQYDGKQKHSFEEVCPRKSNLDRTRLFFRTMFYHIRSHLRRLKI